ncbi:MAG: hypothetical protein PSU93_15025 [Methylobacter sp.]|uniref:Uncharacterized protein n=1 Tax=Candidatus Methylobacter titanis TaxID=3053457 RepID=A0AA43TR11_9GAMM|nr:hypothetical protein [Candidatus Methylobacter titanis]
MLSIKEKDALDWVLVHANEIEDATARLNKRLGYLSNTINNEIRSENQGEENLLSAQDAERLLQLNRHLTKLQDFLNAQELAISPVLAGKEADPDDPMADYEIETVLHYTLREDDPEWSEDSDNFMTQRESSLKGAARSSSEPDDWREYLPSMEAINTEPHCWLFHDLYDHSYGLTSPKVPLRDCLRLGEVWVDIVIRQQYWLNLETGDWEKKVESE